MIHKTQYIGNQFDKLYKDYIYGKHKLIEESKEKLPQIPRGNPAATHIRKMLDDCHCHICNRPAPKDSPYYENIKRLLPENYPSTDLSDAKFIHEKEFEKLSKVQIGLHLNVSSFNEDANKITQNYFQLEQKRVELEEAIEDVWDRKSLVLSDLGLDSLDSGIKRGESYQNLNEQSGSIHNAIGRLENKISEENKEKEALEERYIKLFEGEIDESLRKQMQFFKSLVTATKDAKEQQFQMLVKLLEEETNRHYENINKESGAFYGIVKFHKNNREGYTARIHNNDGEDVTDNMNTSQILSMQLSILLAILSTNKQKGLNKQYPLIADAPNSSFDPEKRKFLLREMGKTFDQAIIMMFEYLEKDEKRTNRYRVNQDGLRDLKKEMKAVDVNLNIIHLDIPDNINPKKLEELSIDIKPL